MRDRGALDDAHEPGAKRVDDVAHDHADQLARPVRRLRATMFGGSRRPRPPPRSAARVASLTRPKSLSTAETDAIDTPARSSRRPGSFAMSPLLERYITRFSNVGRGDTPTETDDRWQVSLDS